MVAYFANNTFWPYSVLSMEKENADRALYFNIGTSGEVQEERAGRGSMRRKEDGSVLFKTRTHIQRW